MTYSTYEINTPSPYLVLSKNDKIPVVLTVGESNSNDKTGIETDVKILTAHKCQTETLITKLGSDTTDDFFVPKGFMESKLSTINEIDALKTGTLTKDSIDLLNKKVHSLASSSVPIIISADELDNETFLLAFKQITPASTLIVCSSSKAKQLLNIQKDMKTEEDAFEIANQLANETSAPNVLMTDCLENDKGSIDVFYCVADQKFVVSNGQTFAAGVDSMISAAVAANLANGFTMNESVYGAIEYTQSAIATTVTTSDDKIPNYMYAIEIPMKKMVQDECFTAHELVSVPQPLKSGPICENFFDYLIKHPLVKPYWDTYVNHEFVNQIANGTLPLKKFQFYVEQDYSYLVDYGRVHCVAGSKAPDLEDMEQELVIVGRIRVEMGQRRKEIEGGVRCQRRRVLQNHQERTSLKQLLPLFQRRCQER
ncbi:uncharacterized protein KNAG_0G02180 [Huiozyma naganishii CBS 8797]|uniref:Uncharacterized protein n=1 Tax=Huiozyma naganishii (strain ATCC MYA-139 / BCRC 22969 / CBS 8797 / KCTC 17520 / NBRC 10181 / NCYC 3082 / Yp74L-3) TaxID=1071383 RepID=J7S934_HUIN7|nr:hypothetical protein KNAG_0G02180 [Kazachstania naganishii CBS 8797]CCK71276.1 hypothetical protein KNAG_0G02180 [Kazachstania naganishii CBS 8797]